MLYDTIKSLLKEKKESKRYNNIRLLESGQGSIIKVNGKDYLNMCSNNYLGWANDTITKDAIKASIDKYGVGPGAVRSISGSYDVHQQFEKRLAEFKGVEDVLVVQSGFTANTVVIQTLTTKDDIIFSDQLNHASIIDGMRLSKATKVVYNHCDMEDLRNKILLNKDSIKGNIFIITDGVFSMDGDIAPLDEMCKIAKEFGAYTIVDDAHGEGVLGKGGRGAVSHFNLEGQIDIEVGTLSKAFGLVGGFIGAKAEVIEYLKQFARPFLFSSSLEVGMCSAGIAILGQMEQSEERVEKLWSNAKYLQEKFVSDGYSIGLTTTPITPFMVGDETVATRLTNELFEEGVLVSPIIFPTVPKGKARIRIMLSSLHTIDQIDEAYKIITEKYNSIIK